MSVDIDGVTMAREAKINKYYSMVASCNRGKVQQVYDNWTTYDEDINDSADYRGPNIGAAIIDENCPDKSISVLDCGAGTGLVGEKLNALGFTNITAIDISPKSLDLAREKGVYKRLVCNEVGNKEIPLKENEFDALVCVGCFIPGHMNQDCFPEWIRIVKPGGIIVLVMCLKYLTEAVEFNNGQLEAAIETFENAKKWKLISKNIQPIYFEEHEGVAFILKIL